MTETWEPGNELEQRLSDALRAGDQDLYFSLVSGADLFIPLPPGDTVTANQTPLTWPTNTHEGRTQILAYTSVEAGRTCLGPVYEHFARMPFADIARSWPDAGWWLAVNAGLPIEGYLPAWFVAQLIETPPEAVSSEAMSSEAAPDQATPDQATPDQAAPDQSGRPPSPAGHPHQPAPDPGVAAVSPQALPGTEPAIPHEHRAETGTVPPPPPAANPAPRPPEDLLPDPGAALPPPAGPEHGAASPRQPAPEHPREPGPDTEPIGPLPPAPQPGATFPPHPLQNAATPRQPTSDDGETTLPRPHPANTEPSPPPAPQPGAAVPPHPLQNAATPRRPTPENGGTTLPRPHRPNTEPPPPAGPVPDVSGPPTAHDIPAVQESTPGQATFPSEGAPVPAAAPVPGAAPAPGEPPLLLHFAEDARFEPVDDQERALYDGARRGDREGFLHTLLNAAQIWVPMVEGGDLMLAPGRPGFAWHTEEVDGRTVVPVFTGPGRMRDAIGGHPYVLSDLTKILRYWPDASWDLVVNGGTPIGASIPGDQIVDLAERVDTAAAARLVGDFAAQGEVERAMFDGRHDPDALIKVLLDASVFLPVWRRTPPSVQTPPADPSFPWAEVPVRGRAAVLVFTSFECMKSAVGATGFVMPSFTDLIGAWPDSDWSAWVNPGTPIEVVLSGEQVLALAGRTPAEPEHGPSEWTLMQKAIPHEQVAWYLDRGYDRVAGFVHRAKDVVGLRTPERLYDALGLLYEGSPFARDDAEVHVIRWATPRPELFSVPFGGPDEDSMRQWGEAGRVIEDPPFEGSGFAPGSGGTIPEYKIDSMRLPHGAKLYAISRDGGERFAARYDADRLAWEVTE